MWNAFNYYSNKIIIILNKNFLFSCIENADRLKQTKRNAVIFIKNATKRNEIQNHLKAEILLTD